jgi:Domain of unknown function (DUF4129)
MRPIAAVLLCAAVLGAQDRYADAVETVYREGRYERELPGRRAPGPGGPEGAFEPRRREREAAPENAKKYPPRKPREIRDVAPEESGVLARAFGSWLLWTAVAAGALVVAFLLIRGRKPKPPAEPAPARETAPVPTAPRAGDPERDPLAEARRLAREGRHPEAIHGVLLAAIERVRAARPVAASLTSRELAAAAALDPAGSTALLSLVRAVEVTLFGGRPAGAAEFEACAAALDQIAP